MKVNGIVAEYNPCLLYTSLARGHLEYLDDMITQTEVELYVRIKPYYELSLIHISIRSLCMCWH